MMNSSGGCKKPGGGKRFASPTKQPEIAEGLTYEMALKQLEDSKEKLALEEAKAAFKAEEGRDITDVEMAEILGQLVNLDLESDLEEVDDTVDIQMLSEMAYNIFFMETGDSPNENIMRVLKRSIVEFQARRTVDSTA